MEQEFLNTYIENMAKRLGDQLKNEILLSTQLEIAQKVVANLTEENRILKERLEKLETRKPKKEVNTSADTF
jgi:hypothetical protein